MPNLKLVAPFALAAWLTTVAPSAAIGQEPCPEQKSKAQFGGLASLAEDLKEVLRFGVFGPKTPRTGAPREYFKRNLGNAQTELELGEWYKAALALEPGGPLDLDVRSEDYGKVHRILLALNPLSKPIVDAMGGMMGDSLFFGKARVGSPDGVQALGGGYLLFYGTDSLPRWFHLDHGVVVPVRQHGKYRYSVTGGHVLDQELKGHLSDLGFGDQQQTILGGLELKVDPVSYPRAGSSLTLTLEAGPGLLLSSGAERIAPAASGQALLNWSFE